jgi:DNA invertase Pin-like site-specific DNA recombinase
VSEFERSVIRERVNAGLAAAKAKGVKLGRPRTLDRHEDEVRRLAAEGISLRKIAATLEIPVGSIFRLFCIHFPWP